MGVQGVDEFEIVEGIDEGLDVVGFDIDLIF